jgi:hypothetical protein
MKRTFNSITLLLACFLCSFATFTDLSGKWYGKLNTADNTPYPLTYNFTMLGDSVAGTAKSTLGEFPIEESRQDTSGLHFKVTVNGLDVFHTAKLYPDSIGMDISLNGSVVHCTLRRDSI